MTLLFTIRYFMGSKLNSSSFDLHQAEFHQGIFSEPAFICKPHGSPLHGTDVHILYTNDKYSSSHITIIACSSAVQFKVCSM